jgi:hypothetical protein
MANYQSKQYANSPNTFPGAFPANAMAFYWEVSITANAANGDTFDFGNVPKGFRLLAASLNSSDIDTNGSPTVTLHVGDSGDNDRIFSAATVGQAGGTTRGDSAANFIATTGFGFLYTADTVITGTIPTGPATGTTGTLKLWLHGRFEGSTT